MVWAKRILVALILLLLACPASAAINRFTDNRGVLHLTNTKVEKARVETREQNTPHPSETGPAAPAAIALPLPETESGAPAGKAEPTKPKSYLTVRQGVIHITNVADPPVEVARGPSAAPPSPGTAPEDSRAALEHPAAPVIPAAFAQMASPPADPSPQPLTADAAVKTYTDQKGVIHITNAPAKSFQGDAMVAGRPSAGKARSSGEVSVASKDAGTKPARKREPQETLPLREASLLESGPPAVLPAMPAALKSSPDKPFQAARAKVRRFQDDKGVIHIVGRGPAPGGRQPALGNRMTTPANLSPVMMAGALIPALPPTVALHRDKQGRLVIQNAPGGPARGGKEEMYRRLAPVLAEAALTYGLPVALIEAVIKIESNFQPRAVSPKGAMGLMQLMPGTANSLGVEDAFCPRENVLGGCRYLRHLLDLFGQSLPLALAAYNAGFQRVIDAGCQVPDIKETRDFVTRVMGHYFLREKQYLARRLNL